MSSNRTAWGGRVVFTLVLLLIPTSTQAAVECTIVGACPDLTYEGGGVAIHTRATVNSGNFVSLWVASIRRNGLPDSTTLPWTFGGFDGITPIDAPDMIFFWTTAPGDAGTWEICFEAADDLGGVDTACHTVVVEVPGANHVQWRSRLFEVGEPPVPQERALELSTSNSGDVVGIVLPFVLTSLSGNAFLSQPIFDPSALGDGTGDILFSSVFLNTFSSHSTNTYSGDAVSPDSLVGGLISFGPSLPQGTYTDAMTVSVTVDTLEGVFRMETRPIAPVSGLTYNDPLGATIVPTFSPGCFAVLEDAACMITLPGDVTDNGSITSADIIRIVGHVFKYPRCPAPCEANADVNCSGDISANDIIYLVNFVFKGSGIPPCNICELIWQGVWKCPSDTGPCW